LARILEHIQIRAKGKLAWLSIDENMLTATGAMQEDANGFINYVRYIEGVEVAVLFREVSGSGVKVSMRSKGDIDVSQIAVRFGGGGHQKAAGCSFNTTLNEAKEQVFAVIEEQLDK
jgi:phosphoesterase RecJ-like protein